MSIRSNEGESIDYLWKSSVDRNDELLLLFASLKTEIEEDFEEIEYDSNKNEEESNVINAVDLNVHIKDAKDKR